ncbi:TPA: hypothetical protein ACKQPR_001496 [Serratia odorifera]|nr:hypothetical protein [Serratia odorifera]
MKYIKMIITLTLVFISSIAFADLRLPTQADCDPESWTIDPAVDYSACPAVESIIPTDDSDPMPKDEKPLQLLGEAPKGNEN